MKKSIILLLLATIVTTAYTQDSLARSIISSEKGEDIVTHIRFLQKHTDNPEEEIRLYVNSLQPAIPIENIATYYLTKFQLSCEAKDPQSILFYAKIYCALGVEEDLSTVFISSAKAAMAIGEDETAGKYLEKLKLYSQDNEGWYDEEVIGLAAEMAEIRNERVKMQRWYKWEEGVRGTWIGEYGSPIIIIDDPANSIGSMLVLESTKTRLKRVNHKLITKVIPKQLNTSQSIQFDGLNRTISLQFASQRIRDRAWLEGVSMTGLELSRTARTETNTYIRTSDLTPKQKIEAEFITNATTDLLNELFTLITVSSRKEDFESYSMYAITENLQEANRFYCNIEIYSDGRNRSYDGSQSLKFVRWEEEDSSFLILPNGNPFFVGSIELNNPMLLDYRRIKWHNSFFNPRFLLPTVVSIGVSGSMIWGAINLFKTSNVSWRAITMFTTGLTALPLLTNLILRECGNGVDKSVNKVLYKDFNSRNMRNIRRKYQKELSFSPAYNPDYNALGATVNVSF